MDPITSFEGEFRWLSNFSPHPVRIEERSWPTSEHAFQALKTHDQFWRGAIWAQDTPGRAKRMGRQVPLRPDWEQVKVVEMHRVVKAKFRQHPELQRLLLATDDAPIIEGNTWGDRFWGQVDGVGQNNLGRILMLLRADLRAGLES